MCGIVAILDVKAQTKALREKALRMSQKIRLAAALSLLMNDSALSIRRVADNLCFRLTVSRSWL